MSSKSDDNLIEALSQIAGAEKPQLQSKPRLVWLQDEVRDLRVAIEAAVDAMPWVPVDVNLPENDRFVFIRRDGRVLVAKRVWVTLLEIYCWVDEKQTLIENGVTHWTLIIC